MGIDEGFPERWHPGDIIAKAKEGMALGVWHPQTHGRAHHYSPHKWVRTLRLELDAAVVAFFEFGLVGFVLPTANPDEVKGLEFDDMTPDELDLWFGEGLGMFRRAFGYDTPCAPITDAREGNHAELQRMLSRYGIKYRSHSNLGTRPADAELGATDPELGMTYLGWTGFLDPIGKPDGPDVRGFTRAYDSVLRSWSENKPAIIGTHRINYVSLNPEHEYQGFTQLEQLLATITQKQPDAVFLTSDEVGQLYRTGTSALRLGHEVVCRNYSGGRRHFTLPLSEDEYPECLRNLRTELEIPTHPSDGGVTFKVGDGEYVLHLLLR